MSDALYCIVNALNHFVPVGLEYIEMAVVLPVSAFRRHLYWYDRVLRPDT